MNILGVDLSLTGTGVSDGKETWLIPSDGKKEATLEERYTRIHDIAYGAVSYACSLDVVLIEGPSLGSSHGHAHDRAGLWWMTVALLLNDGFDVVEVPPSTLKKYATGKGNASKSEMVDAAARRLPDVVTGADDNRIDALWLAAIGHDLAGHPLVKMPETHRVALKAVRWPEKVITGA